MKDAEKNRVSSFKVVSPNGVLLCSLYTWLMFELFFALL